MTYDKNAKEKKVVEDEFEKSVSKIIDEKITEMEA